MRATRSTITSLPLGGYTMRYLIFSFVALFLNACADTDNPVVYTAPAGKVTEDEVKQPPGTNAGSSTSPRGARTITKTITKTILGNILTPSALVSNIERTHTGQRNFQNDMRQDFRTGVLDYSGSWRLTEVKLRMLFASGGPTPSYTVAIWTTTNNNGTVALDQQIGTLTNPSSLKTGLNTFKGDIDLDANTVYSLVLDSSKNSFHYEWRTTAQTGNWPTTGWAILGSGYWRSALTTNPWTRLDPGAFLMAIYGLPPLPPASTQSEIDRHSTPSLPLGNSACETIDENGNVVGRGPCWWQEAWDTGDAGLRESIKDEWRYEHLREDGVLPTLSISGCRVGTDTARFTITRNDPTDEGLVFSLQVGDTTITSGFSAGMANSRLEEPIPAGGTLTARLIPGWHNDMNGDYQLGISEATVSSSSSLCQ